MKKLTPKELEVVYNTIADVCVKFGYPRFSKTGRYVEDMVIASIEDPSARMKDIYEYVSTKYGVSVGTIRAGYRYSFIHSTFFETGEESFLGYPKETITPASFLFLLERECHKKLLCMER